MIYEVPHNSKKENKLEKILFLGKIKGRVEYKYVTEMVLITKQIKMTSKEETRQLSDMLGQYESRKNN